MELLPASDSHSNSLTKYRCFPCHNEFCSEKLLLKYYHHMHTVFRFIPFCSFSPVKQQRSHPLFHSYTSFNLRIFIKTCNNTRRSLCVHGCLSDMKAERVFRQRRRQLHGHMKGKKLVSGKGHPLLHRLHFLQCITIQTHPYHGAIYPPAHSETPRGGRRGDMALLQVQFHFHKGSGGEKRSALDLVYK